MAHEIAVCSCGRVIYQCRCPGPHPIRVIAGGCGRCGFKGRNADPDTILGELSRAGVKYAIDTLDPKDYCVRLEGPGGALYHEVVPTYAAAAAWLHTRVIDLFPGLAYSKRFND